jgi:hypothetical protein
LLANSVPIQLKKVLRKIEPVWFCSPLLQPAFAARFAARFATAPQDMFSRWSLKGQKKLEQLPL